MRVLMVAPEPVLRARGTPLSVYQRIHALSQLGHQVELLTYPFGDPIELPELVVRRSHRPWGIRDVGIGPTFHKILLDVPLFRLAIRVASSARFDLFHTHEEAGPLGAYLSRRFGVPHIYDMHSSLPEQFSNFGRFNWSPVVGAFRLLERYTLGASAGVIAICEELGTLVRERGYRGELAIIENTHQFGSPDDMSDDAGRGDALRARLKLNGEPVVLYAGTLEPYQGLDLLIDAVPHVVGECRNARFVVLGGAPRQVEKLRRIVRRRGLESFVIVQPAVRPEQVRDYYRIANVLITCRTRGLNTPLKIYHYLHAGRPIVATAIRSHTQVLDGETAELVAPEPASIARGVLRVLNDRERAEALSRAAVQMARARYEQSISVERLADLLARVTTRTPQHFALAV